MPLTPREALAITAARQQRDTQRHSMKNGTRFTVLIERRRQPHTSLAWWMTLLVLAALALMPHPGEGKPLLLQPRAKIAEDLQAAIVSNKGRAERWSRKVDGV